MTKEHKGLERYGQIVTDENCRRSRTICQSYSQLSVVEKAPKLEDYF